MMSDIMLHLCVNMASYVDVIGVNVVGVWVALYRRQHHSAMVVCVETRYAHQLFPNILLPVRGLAHYDRQEHILH